ncbi:MAG: quinolinate synthase NadA [Deltaproteobacteria bacterium]|nr:MAG: quinolinate synthase NadA [Deltaproteobacteria bacterium]
MKKIELDDIMRTLKTLSPVIEVEEDIRVKAYGAVKRMLEVPRD